MPAALSHPAPASTAPAWPADWATALLDPSRPAPPGLHSWNGSDPAQRFDVHRNNALSGLTAALADNFPVVQAEVGAEFFAAMARCFIAAQPPHSVVLAQFGAGLPDFIAGFAPAAELPYLADLARLEQARVRAFHAADAQPLTAGGLARQLATPSSESRTAPPGTSPDARLTLHPSLSVLKSRFAVVSIWASQQADAGAEAVDWQQPEAAWVLRQGDAVVVVKVTEATADFCQGLIDGLNLAQAVAAAQADAAPAAAPLDLGHTLALLLAQAALVAWR